MIDKLVEYFKDKNILILGFGREGRSSYNFIRKYYKDKLITISDMNKDLINDETIKNDPNIKLVTDNYLEEIYNGYDCILKSPGIILKDYDLTNIYEYIVSEMELFLTYFEGLTIGITGTKGKSTTSSLIYKIISDQKDNVYFLGNIGIPVFDQIENLNKESIVVLEMGVHQLQYMNKSPNISIILNMFPEHLDHYKDYDDYMECKCNIFKHQNEKDYFIYNLDNEDLVNKVKMYKTPATKYEVSLKEGRSENRLVLEDNKIYLEDTLLYEDNNERNILGKHNLNNIMFVLAVSNILNLDNEKSVKSINDFKGLEHRLELVGTYNGITYYNDSICTIPEACILALETLKNVNTLLIGGMERDIDYSKLVDYLNNYGELNIICMPDTGYRIAKSLTSDKLNVVEVKDLVEAVEVSKKITKKGAICLLSPAAASYGFFKNFEERGNKFKELVKE